jgi:hypothetical protein
MNDQKYIFLLKLDLIIEVYSFVYSFTKKVEIKNRKKKVLLFVIGS